MEQKIRDILRECLVTKVKQGQQIAKAIYRPPSYVTRMHRAGKDGELTVLSPRTCLVKDKNSDEKVELQRKGMFALVCWLIAMRPDKDMLYEELRQWLTPDFEEIRGTSIAQGAKFIASNEHAVKWMENRLSEVGGSTRRVSPMTVTAAQRVAVKAAQPPLPKQPEPTEPAAVMLPQSANCGVTNVTQTKDVSVTVPTIEEFRAVMVLIRARAEAGNGLYSLKVLNDELRAAGVKGLRAPEHLRNKAVKESIVIEFEKAGKVCHIDVGSRSVEDIPQMPGIILHDQAEYGWCLNANLFTGYCMTIEPRLASAARDVLSGEHVKPREHTDLDDKIGRIADLLELSVTNQIAVEERLNKKIAEVEEVAKSSKVSEELERKIQQQQTALEHLFATAARDSNNYKSAIGLGPIGYYTRKVMVDGLKLALNSFLTERMYNGKRPNNPFYEGIVDTAILHIRSETAECLGLDGKLPTNTIVKPLNGPHHLMCQVPFRLTFRMDHGDGTRNGHRVYALYAPDLIPVVVTHVLSALCFDDGAQHPHVGDRCLWHKARVGAMPKTVKITQELCDLWNNDSTRSMVRFSALLKGVLEEAVSRKVSSSYDYFGGHTSLRWEHCPNKSVPRKVKKDGKDDGDEAN